MKLRILCNWMTPASNIVIQSQFGRLATADVLGLKPIISLSLDWLCGITLGFPQCSRWWRLKGISSRSLILLPIHALFYIKQSIILPLARKMPHSHAWCSPHAQRDTSRGARATFSCSAPLSLPCIAKFAGVSLQAKSDAFPSPALCGTGISAHLRWQQGLRNHQDTPDGWENWGELQIHGIMKPLGPSARLIVYFRSLSAITSTNGYGDRFQASTI